MSDIHRGSWRVGAGVAVLIALAPLAGAQDVPEPVSAPGMEPGVGPVTHLPLPRFVSMRGESANARRGPSLDQRVDWEFQRPGMPLEITAEYGNWRRVRDVDGKGGWVHHALLSGNRAALVVGTERVALREEPRTASRIVAIAEPGVVGRVRECEGAWCEMSADGREGWLPRATIWGVGPDETVD